MLSVGYFTTIWSTCSVSDCAGCWSIGRTLTGICLERPVAFATERYVLGEGNSAPDNSVKQRVVRGRITYLVGILMSHRQQKYRSVLFLSSSSDSRMISS